MLQSKIYSMLGIYLHSSFEQLWIEAYSKASTFAYSACLLRKKQISPLHLEHLKNFVTKVVDHLHGDLARLRSRERVTPCSFTGWDGLEIHPTLDFAYAYTKH